MIARYIDRLFGGWTEWMLRPVSGLSPWWGLAVSAFAMAFLAILAFKYFSNQSALVRARNRMLAHTLALYLFRDEPSAIFPAFGRILFSAGAYTLQTLRPVLVVLAPMVLLLVHMARWYEVRPLLPGESSLLTVVADAASAPTLSARPVGPLDLETDAFVTRGGEALWRFRALRAGESSGFDILGLSAPLRKEVVVSTAFEPVTPTRAGPGFWNRLAYPGEPPLPKDSPVRAIRIEYPRRVLRMGAMTVHWVVALFVLSIAFGLVLKYPLRVEF